MVDSINEGDWLPPLPNTSINGIDGTWTPPINNTLTTDYTFIPLSNDCVSETTITIYVVPNTSQIDHQSMLSIRKLIKIVDLLGRESQPKANTPLFYIYDNGRVEKRLIMDKEVLNFASRQRT